jgi:hypothetical protein
MLQIDGEIGQGHAGLGLVRAHRAAVQFGQVQLDVRMGLVDLLIEAAQFLDLNLVAGLVQLHHRTQHHLDNLAHAQQLARRAGQRQARRVQDRAIERTDPARHWVGRLGFRLRVGQKA